jgi:hypothetical protein
VDGSEKGEVLKAGKRGGIDNGRAGWFDGIVFKLAQVVLGAVLILAGCGKKSEQAEAASEAPLAVEEAAKTRAPANPAIAKANDALAEGSYDQAAARLLEAKMNSADFTPRDAAAYREAMQEAYSKALEAAEKGDEKARAALEMIRAARQ